MNNTAIDNEFAQKGLDYARSDLMAGGKMLENNEATILGGNWVIKPSKA